MKISKKSQYCLRALVYLSKENRYCSAKEIAEAEAIPFDYLEKILAVCKEHKLVTVKRGVQGGYTLARDPKTISVGNVVKTFEGTFAPVLCVAKEKEKQTFCPRCNKCRTRSVWEKVQDTLGNTLNSISLASLSS